MSCIRLKCTSSLSSQFTTPKQKTHIRPKPSPLLICVPNFMRLKASLAPQKQLPVSWQIICCHGNSVLWKLTIFTIKHHQGLKISLTKFEGDMVNLLFISQAVHQSLVDGLGCMVWPSPGYKMDLSHSSQGRQVPVTWIGLGWRPAGLLHSRWATLVGWPCRHTSQEWVAVVQEFNDKILDQNLGRLLDEGCMNPPDVVENYSAGAGCRSVIGSEGQLVIQCYTQSLEDSEATSSMKFLWDSKKGSLCWAACLKSRHGLSWLFWWRYAESWVETTRSSVLERRSGAIDWRRWERIGSRGQVVGRWEVTKVSTSLGETGEKEIRLKLSFHCIVRLNSTRFACHLSFSST